MQVRPAMPNFSFMDELKQRLKDQPKEDKVVFKEYDVASESFKEISREERETKLQ